MCGGGSTQDWPKVLAIFSQTRLKTAFSIQSSFGFLYAFPIILYKSSKIIKLSNLFRQLPWNENDISQFFLSPSVINTFFPLHFVKPSSFLFIPIGSILSLSLRSETHPPKMLSRHQIFCELWSWWNLRKRIS